MSVSSALGIPIQQDPSIEWDSDKLKKTYPNKELDKTFLKYIGVMDLLQRYASEGILFNKSIMFISEAGTGKHTFSYIYMRKMAEKGYSICPMFDHNEYLRACVLTAERPFEKIRLSMDEVIYSDVVIMSVDYCNQFAAMKAIKSLLDKRANVGKSTIILSNFAITNLVSARTRDLEIRYSDGSDPLRYCRVVKADL